MNEHCLDLDILEGERGIISKTARMTGIKQGWLEQASTRDHSIDSLPRRTLAAFISLRLALLLPNWGHENFPHLLKCSPQPRPSHALPSACHLLWPECLLYFSGFSENDKPSLCPEGLVVVYLIDPLFSKLNLVFTISPVPNTEVVFFFS